MALCIILVDAHRPLDEFDHLLLAFSSARQKLVTPCLSNLYTPSTRMLMRSVGLIRLSDRSEPRPHDWPPAFVAFHDNYRTELCITVPREYLITLGRRK
jgi:hypothetical protein